ncbi:MAG: ATP-binding protein [Acidobacteriota bacterium]|nr:ATP-binding protein [Acidobacteriota bacterium]
MLTDRILLVLNMAPYLSYMAFFGFAGIAFLCHLLVVRRLEATFREELSIARHDAVVRLECERDRLQQILDRLPYALYWQDSNMVFQGCNLAFAEGAGLDHTDQVIGKTVVDLFWEDPAAERKCDLEALANGVDGASYEWVRPGPGGEKSHMLTRKWALFQGDRLNGILGFYADVSIFKKYEIELRRSQEAAECVGMARGLFLGNMADELKVPVNGILSYAGFGIKIDGNTERMRQYFQMIDSCAQNQLRLLDDIIDLSRLQTGRTRLNLVPADIPGLMKKTLESIRPRAAEQSLFLELHEMDLPDPFPLDEVRIGRVLEHLIHRSCRTAHSGTTIILAASRGPSGLRICVRNRGAGLPVQETRQLFDKLYSADNRNTGSRGEDLELAVSREIVTLHRGKIWAENLVTGGLAFYFEIPPDLAGQLARGDRPLSFQAVARN